MSPEDQRGEFQERFGTTPGPKVERMPRPSQVQKNYEDVVYYNQRKGGDGWFHGRVSNAYRDNYNQIFGNNRSLP